MVNTRAKTSKIENTVKNSFLKAAMADSDLQSTESGAEVGSIDDLLIEILHRLPATSVLRFKSVSKHWESLLEEESFTLRFDKLLRSPGLFVHNSYVPFDAEDRSPPPFRTLDFCLDIYGIRIKQSCNGLMLCCSNRGLEYARKYYVFNPTTKHFAIIPPVPRGRVARNGVCFMGLAFHQTDCPHYKVVCIHHLPKSDWQKVHIQVYSSETRQWKFTNESFSSKKFTYGVYWNGAILWAPCSLTPLCFNLDVERLQKLPLPSPLPWRFTPPSRFRHGIDQPLYFGESRGHLHMVETAPGGNCLHLNVYEMLMDRSQWFVKYQVELDELPALYPEMIRYYEPLSSTRYYEFAVYDVVRGDEEDETFMVVAVPGGIIRYNIMNKSFKQIFDLSRSEYYRIIKHLQVHRYTEALTEF